MPIKPMREPMQPQRILIRVWSPRNMTDKTPTITTAPAGAPYKSEVIESYPMSVMMIEKKLME
jgi:hypothetical protein